MQGRGCVKVEMEEEGVGCEEEEEEAGLGCVVAEEGEVVEVVGERAV